MRVQEEKVLWIDHNQLVGESRDAVEALQEDGVVEVDDEKGERRHEDARADGHYFSVHVEAHDNVVKVEVLTFSGAHHSGRRPKTEHRHAEVGVEKEAPKGPPVALCGELFSAKVLRDLYEEVVATPLDHAVDPVWR